LLGPVLLVALFLVAGRTATEKAEKPLELPIVGGEHAPQLVAFLEGHGVEATEPPEDPDAAVIAGDVDVVLEIPAGWAAAIAAGNPATVRLVFDDSRQMAGVSVRRARALLEAYAGMLASSRLIVRGVDPVIVQPLAVETRDLATDQSRAAMLLSIAPYFIILSIFLGGMYLAIDATAGERERGSLEPLLMTPATRGSLVLGKYAAVVLFTVVALVETLIAFDVVLELAPLERVLGFGLSLGMGALVRIFLLSAPIVLLAAALQMIIASFTKSFKEAQNYLSILPLAPALPGMFLAFVAVKPTLWHMLVPTLGQQILINEVLRGDSVDPGFAVVSALATAAVAAGLVALAIRLYGHERLLASG